MHPVSEPENKRLSYRWGTTARQRHITLEPKLSAGPVWCTDVPVWI